MARKEIINLIQKGIKSAQARKDFPKFEISEILVETPEKEGQGDYSTNIAMKIAKEKPN
jgi:arginyl-tRNA synthetase